MRLSSPQFLRSLCYSVRLRGEYTKGRCVMGRTSKQAVAAAAILAAISIGGVATVVGCRAFQERGSPVPTSAGSLAVPEVALGAAAGGIEAVKAHTAVAQELVERAIPNANPVGQAQLSAAGVEHQAVVASADSTAGALARVQEELAAVARQLQAAREETAQVQAKLTRLAGEWYVVWGLRIEKAFWTAAIAWLLVSIASAVLGTGNPVAWIGKLRNALAVWRA